MWFPCLWECLWSSHGTHDDTCHFSLWAPVFLGKLKLQVKLLARKIETCGGGEHTEHTAGNDEAEDEEEDNELPDRIRNPAHYNRLIGQALVTYGSI